MVQKSGIHQLRLVDYPIIYRVLYIPGGDDRISEPSTVLGKWPAFIHCEQFSSGIMS